MTDFEIFYQSARCWLNGADPYTCGLYYPFTTLFIFLPFALLPLPIAKIAWSIAGLVVMVSIFKWRIFWYFFYIPVLQCFAFGQVDLFLLPALFIRNSVSMALLTLKPQLIWLYLPFWFWQASKRERVLFILTVAVLWSLSFLIWPAWILHFNTRPIPVAVYASPSLFGGEVLPWWTGIIVGVTLIILSRDKLAATTAVNPFIQMYDLILLLPGAKWWIVPLSWLCWGLYYWSGLIFPYVLLPILTIIVPQYIIKQFNSINATWEVDYDRQSPPI